MCLWHQEIHNETRSRGAFNTAAISSLFELQHQTYNGIREVAETLNRMQQWMEWESLQTYHTEQ